MSGVSALIKEIPSLPFVALVGYNEKMAICNPKESPHQNPTLLYPELRLPAAEL